ncbi:MAG: hypothetical protein DRQ02_07965 [Candidatus Latescibacterota bacterium]|nr:MAG: hypothetical protein DRQ02_07965 [Candidatus Latescibacterota bacterium]RKY71152.1 MAG: hypothetical protein DRQ24_07945 [Candidatus Latescibacterota bacterium]
MEICPRHQSVPKLYRGLAYGDRHLPTGQGQTMSQPYIIALMTEILEANGRKKLLRSPGIELTYVKAGYPSADYA